MSEWRLGLGQAQAGYKFPTAFSLWEEEEYDAIRRVFSSGRLTMGKEVETFEEAFARFHNRRYAIMVNSGSSANLVATAALFNKKDKPLKPPRPTWSKGRGGGMDNVGWSLPQDAIVPAIAWSTTYAPLVQHGLDLVVLDVDETWNCPIPKWVPQTKTGLIVCASILGNPGYLHEWREKARRIGAYLIEDNCESLGAYPIDDGMPCGGYGDLSTFSFFYSHQISAIEGGMILTDDEELARLCRMLRAHGWSRGVEPPESFEREYDFRLMGYNVRPLELHAAIAREQLKKLPRFREERRENWVHFTNLASGLPVRFPEANGQTLSPFGLPFTCETKEARSELVGALRARGIDCRLPTGGSFLKHAYGAPYASHTLTPEADRIHDTGLFLGNAPYPIPELIGEAVSVMREVLG
jgi:CDP-6-deoxy-D-xylo-4-hexulose-3-dehydrase